MPQFSTDGMTWFNARRLPCLLKPDAAHFAREFKQSTETFSFLPSEITKIE